APPNVLRTSGASPAARRLSALERGDQGIDLLLVRSLAAGIDARAGGIADPQHDLLRPRRIVDQHGRGVERIEVPALVERAVEQVDAGAGRADLGVAGNDDAAALERAAHHHAEARVDHGGTVLEVATG